MRVLLLLLVATIAQADETSAEARARYQRGTHRYQLNDYQGALAEFETAYRLKADAALLFNVAQCHRQLGQFQEAAERYREFLRKAGDLDQSRRKKIEQLIEALSQEGKPSSEPLITSLIVEQPMDAPPMTTPTPPPPAPVKKPPLYTRWWLWTSVSAVVVVGVGVGLGLGLSHPTVQPTAMTDHGTHPF